MTKIQLLCLRGLCAALKASLEAQCSSLREPSVRLSRKTFDYNLCRLFRGSWQTAWIDILANAVITIAPPNRTPFWAMRLLATQYVSYEEFPVILFGIWNITWVWSSVGSSFPNLTDAEKCWVYLFLYLYKNIYKIKRWARWGKKLGILLYENHRALYITPIPTGKRPGFLSVRFVSIK